MRVAVGAVTGFVMGTALDYLHVRSGTASYHDVWLVPYLDVAWYVPVEFTAAGAIVVTVRPELDEVFERREDGQSAPAVITGLLLLALAWWGSGYLTGAFVVNSAIASVLTLFGAGMWAIFDGTRQGAIAAALTAVLGVVVESLLVYSGTYAYRDPDLLLVPQWLPSLYVTACVAVGNLGRYMKYSWRPAVALRDTESAEPRRAQAA